MRQKNKGKKSVLSVVLTLVMLFAMLPLNGFEVKASTTIWVDAAWIGGHEHSMDHLVNGMPSGGVTYSQLESTDSDCDRLHYMTGRCSCGATCTVTGIHYMSTETGSCEECGYHPQYYVYLEYSLAEGVTAPAGFVKEERKGPYDYGASYTVFAKSYDGLKAERVSGYSSDTIYGNRTVEYEYSYVDPCTKGGNHDWSYVSVDESTHDYRCSKCSESLGTGHHDHEGKSNRSLDCCQFACSQCGFKKTFVAHNFEKYPLTNKDGSTSYIKVCLNCGFETTDCEHEWETEQFVEEGGDHVRVCKLCGFEDRHAIDCEGSWSFVHKKDICRLPCCRKCKQTTIYNIDETACIHEFVIENTGKPDTHRVRCKNCTDVIEENDPCFSEQAWIVASSGLSSEEYEEMCSKIVTDNGDNTYTVHCPCGNTITDNTVREVNSTGKVELKGFESVDDSNAFQVVTPPLELTEEEWKKLKDSLTDENSLTQKSVEWGLESVDDLHYYIEGEPAQVTLTEGTKTEGEGDNLVQTAKMDITKGYKITITGGDGNSYVIQNETRIYSSYPTKISVPTPADFGQIGDTVRIDHTHEGKSYVYYGKVSTYEGQKVITFTSEHGLSPFVFTVSKAVDEEYKTYILSKTTETKEEEKKNTSNNTNTNTGNRSGGGGGSTGGSATTTTPVKTVTGNSVSNNSVSGNTATVTKAENTLKVKTKKVAVNQSKLKKKKVTISNAVTVVEAEGEVSYKLTGVVKKKYSKFFKINAKTGKITVKKKLKKGIYKLKVSVTAAGNEKYEEGVKTVTVKVRVK